MAVTCGSRRCGVPPPGAPLILASLPPAWITGTGNPNAFFITRLLLAVLYAAAIFTTWERKLAPESIAQVGATPHVPVMTQVLQSTRSVGQTFANSSFVKHVAVYLFSLTGRDFFSSALTFFAIYAIHETESIGLYLRALSIIGLPVTVAAGFLMVKKGPRYL